MFVCKVSFGCSCCHLICNVWCFSERKWLEGKWLAVVSPRSWREPWSGERSLLSSSFLSWDLETCLQTSNHEWELPLDWLDNKLECHLHTWHIPVWVSWQCALWSLTMCPGCMHSTISPGVSVPYEIVMMYTQSIWGCQGYLFIVYTQIKSSEDDRFSPSVFLANRTLYGQISIFSALK